MANSNNIEKYRPLIGQSVKFYKDRTFGREYLRGTLIDLLYNDRDRQLYAVIDRYTTVLNRHTQTKVPVTNITITVPARDRYQPMPENFRHERDQNYNSNNYTTNNVHRKPEDTIKLGNDTYVFDDVSVLSTIKIGHEVVWLRGDAVSPLIGKITRLGARYFYNGDREIVAIVQFDQQTCTLPRYIQHAPPNRNIVGLNDLLLLSDWLKTNPGQSSNPVSSRSDYLPQSHPYKEPPVKQVVIVSKEESKRPAKANSPAKSDSDFKPLKKSKAEPNLIDFDGEVPSTSSQVVEPHLTVARSEPKKQREEIPEFKWTSQISPDVFCLTVCNAQKTMDKCFGIQGYNNSCYMDSAIFALFAFNNSLDRFLSLITDFGRPEKKTQLTEEAKQILRADIIAPFRQYYFVSWKAMRKLRAIFVKEVGFQYKTAYMDAEEFILALFSLLNTPELFTYDHGGSDYIHQIVLPTTWKESDRVPYISMQQLLEDSFVASEVKFREPPQSAFIIKLPVSDGKLISSDGVIPNLTIDMSKLVERTEQEADNAVVMHLHAVICLRSNHFVTFACMDPPGNKTQRWVFMDSKPTTKEPEVYILEDASNKIKQAESEKDFKQMSKLEPKIGGIKLFKDAYICVYVP